MARDAWRGIIIIALLLLLSFSLWLLEATGRSKVARDDSSTCMVCLLYMGMGMLATNREKRTTEIPSSLTVSCSLLVPFSFISPHDALAFDLLPLHHFLVPSDHSIFDRGAGFLKKVALPSSFLARELACLNINE